jgi:hypothetical protein
MLCCLCLVLSNLKSDLGDVVANVAYLRSDRSMAPAFNFCFCAHDVRLLLYSMLLRNVIMGENYIVLVGTMHVMENYHGLYGRRRVESNGFFGRRSTYSRHLIHVLCALSSCMGFLTFTEHCTRPLYHHLASPQKRISFSLHPHPRCHYFNFNMPSLSSFIDNVPNIARSVSWRGLSASTALGARRQ